MSPQPVSYLAALRFMEQRVAEIRDGLAPELIWLLEHPPLITAGTSSTTNDLLMPDRFDVFSSGRGGQYTYHGPGQRVVYVMLDLTKHGRDVRKFIRQLEQWLIGTLAVFDLSARRYDDRVGVWVDAKTPAGDNTEAKIAAIGIRIRKWVSFHGVSINVNPVLEHFSAIVPCGISDLGVTSFADLGLATSLGELDLVLRHKFIEQFSAVEMIEPPFLANQ